MMLKSEQAEGCIGDVCVPRHVEVALLVCVLDVKNVVSQTAIVRLALISERTQKLKSPFYLSICVIWMGMFFQHLIHLKFWTHVFVYNMFSLTFFLRHLIQICNSHFIVKGLILASSVVFPIYMVYIGSLSMWYLQYFHWRWIS